MNKVILLGRTTKEVEAKAVKVGKENHKVVTISLAVGQGDKTNFIELVAWDKKAEVFEKYITKGTRILVEGSLINQKYEDKDKNTRYRTYVLVSSVEFADSKKETNNDEVADDLPF